MTSSTTSPRIMFFTPVRTLGGIVGIVDLSCHVSSDLEHLRLDEAPFDGLRRHRLHYKTPSVDPILVREFQEICIHFV